jgi:putative ABC transport system substrate-binding protein
MNRRNALAALLAALAMPAVARSQTATPPRLGYLSLQSITERPSRERQAFLDGLREYGRVPGESIEIVYRSAENEPDFLQPMCEELLRAKVDVLATPGALSTLVALKVTHTVPIVFLAVGDPVGFGAVESLARPGRNATGTTFISSELASKRIEYLRLAVPGVKRIAFLWDRKNRNGQIETEAAQTAAARLGIASEALSFETQAELNATLERIERGKHDAIYVSFTAGVVAANRTTIAEFGLRQGVPVISGWSFMTEAGGLLSYAPDVPTMFRRSAFYVDRILKGANPAELPVERATKIELVLNVGTAQRLGLTLPPDLLLLADRTIE